MIGVLRNAAYAKLFAAQVIALLGTGLLTVALGLLAFDIAGGDAGLVLGTALTIKMIAYVGVSPLMAAATARVPRRALLVTADLLRAGIALSLPFIEHTGQIYLLVFLLQSASATFTPAFQAVIPAVLPNERQYTSALSLSRLAYDLESLLSPVLAAALLTVVDYPQLFVGTAIGFAVSAALVLATALPAMRPAPSAPFRERLTRGTRLFLRLPELRGLLAMHLVVAAASAMVIVNTVVLVQGDLGRPQTDVALLLAAYGAGSMLVALTLPRILDTVSDRAVMVGGATALPVTLAAMATVTALAPDALVWALALAIWALAGAATSLVLTPSSRLLRRSVEEADLPAAFAAQFSLSHACFLVAYPLAGFIGAASGVAVAAGVLAVLAAAGAAAAHLAWRPPVESQARR